MQMTLQMVAICLSIDGNNQVDILGDRLGQQLEDLAVQITDIQVKVSKSNQDLSGGTTAAEDINGKSHMKHIEEHIQTAEIILSNASAYSKSVSATVVGHGADVANLTGAFGSVLGMDDVQRHRVKDWLPREGVPSDDDSDDDDTDKDLFLARVKVAQKRLVAKEYEAAQSQFEACLSNKPIIESLPLHELVELRLDLAEACRGAGNAKKQQDIINQLLTLELPKFQELHIKHTLAVAYFGDFRLEEARESAEEARKGRKKHLGRQHESYLETLALLVTICKAQGDNDTADVYQDLLPPDYHNIIEAQPKVLREADRPVPDQNNHEIRWLSDKEYDIKNKKTYFEALQYAKNERKLPIVRFLLQYSTDFTAKDKDGKTMLTYACENGFADIAEKLLNQGADIKVLSGEGRSLLFYALDHKAVLKLLFDRGAGIDWADSLDFLLFVGVLHRAVESVEFLLDNGADFNYRGTHFETPLQSAARIGHFALVRLVLDRGAQIDLTTRLAIYTPLMYATREGHVEVMRLLLSRGADTTIKTSGANTTAFDLAQLWKIRNPEVPKLLKEAQN
ncbi:hypothetical protein ONS96_009792 [Cadophora gregata f. sp. sojae]|nr:hypothetical protein ONS96_009792 [Cadophora gregata f. sp. sojae]